MFAAVLPHLKHVNKRWEKFLGDVQDFILDEQKDDFGSFGRNARCNQRSKGGRLMSGSFRVTRKKHRIVQLDRDEKNVLEKALDKLAVIEEKHCNISKLDKSVLSSSPMASPCIFPTE